MTLLYALICKGTVRKKKIGTIGSLLWVYGDRQETLNKLCKDTIWKSENLQLK